MHRQWLATAATSGFVAVALGAFGAHGLKARVSPEYLAVWQAAVQYQMFHTLGLLAVAVAGQHLGRRASHWVGALFVAGIVVFSGSLYTLVLTDLRWLGAIAPIGGAAFLAGWIALAVAAIRRPGI